MSPNDGTQQLKMPVIPGLSTDTDPGRTRYASSAAASVSPTAGLDPTRGRDASPYSSASALAERVVRPLSDTPLPPPPLPLLLLSPLPSVPPLPLLPEPPPPPPLLELPPQLLLPTAPVFVLPLAFLAGASPAAVTLASALPSADPPLVAPRRLVPLPAARAGPTCVNTRVAPNRHLPFFSNCRHSPSRAPAATVDATVERWTSALIRPPLDIFARRRGQCGPGIAGKAATAREVGPAVTAEVRNGAKIQCDSFQVVFDQIRQPDPAPAVVGDGTMLPPAEARGLRSPQSRAVKCLGAAPTGR